MHRMHRIYRIFSGDGRLAVLDIRKSVRDHRRSLPLVQQLVQGPPVLIILCILSILCIDVEWMVPFYGSDPSQPREDPIRCFPF